MRKLLLLATAASAVCLSGAANAATCGTYTAGVQTCFYTAGLDPQFDVTFHGSDGTISATVGHNGIALTNFQDIFYFFTDEDGLGSGSVTTSTSRFHSVTDLDFTGLDIYTGATYNGDGTFTGGTITHVNAGPTGFSETIGGVGVPITALENNYIVLYGVSRGNGSYGGQVTFEPNAVPEPATWAMMLFGFGAVGFGLRRRKKEQVRVRYAF